MLVRRRAKRAQSTIVFLLAILIIAAFITRWLDISIIAGSITKFYFKGSQVYSEEFDCSLECSQISPITVNITNTPTHTCPEYFKWIHEDLKPWKRTGITREMVESGKHLAHTRVIIVNGRLYVEKYKDAFQTRDVVTIWGLLQLLRLYPGRVPDLDLMFECDDITVVKKDNYSSPNALIPPPVFHYCGDEGSYDIVFPDWSFWGWPEVNIKPWEELKEDLQEANERLKWTDREPYAYWKGNTKLAFARRDLVKCNNTEGQNWIRIYGMEWAEEKKQGFKNSDLASQCNYRYKIYVEGVSWSVSQKYILACGSMTLGVKPRYYDFFARSLVPSVHYWPINKNNTCGSVKFAVEWGNKHTDMAQEVGKAGRKFVQENLAMEYIYDYSFHLLNEYAKLLKYTPTVPEGAIETCSETLICSVKGQKRRFRKHSMVKNPADSPPCALPPPYKPAALRAFLEKKEDLTKKVMLWEEGEKKI